MKKLLLAAIAAACLLPCLYPGDVPWINDEPLLIDHALKANSESRLEQAGLNGTHGMHYGGFPTWVYQVLLLASHDLKVIAVLHTLLWMGAIALGLWWLSSATGYWPWYIPVILLSPYLWLYSRMLWDIFNIPLSALALGAYAKFSVNKKLWSLLTCLGCCAAMALCHLNSIPFIIPILISLIVFYRAELKKHLQALTIFGLVTLIATFNYLTYLIQAHEAVSHFSPSLLGLIFPLQLPRLLTGTGLDYFFGDTWLSSAVLIVVLSSMAYLLAATGCVLMVRHSPKKVEWLVLAILGSQMVFDCVMGVYGHPHYYASTWMVAVVLAWKAIDLASSRIVITSINTAILLTLIGFIFIKIHTNGGVRGIHYGPTLNEQIAVVEHISSISNDSTVTTSVENVALFPHALGTLFRLERDNKQTIDNSRSQVNIRYTSDDQFDAHLAVDIAPY